MKPNPKRTLNVEALYHDLDNRRRRVGLSWRRLARNTGLSASTLSRMQHGARPDADGLASLLAWLGRPLSDFVEAEP